MKRLLIIAGMCAIALLALFICTTPTNIPSIMLIVPFVLAFIGLSLVVATVLRYRGIGSTRSMRLGAVFAGLPILLLVLQSIGQLTIRDIATILALFSLSYFYFARSGAAE